MIVCMLVKGRTCGNGSGDDVWISSSCNDLFKVSWALHKIAGRECLETALTFTAPYNRILFRDLGLTSRLWLNTSYLASPHRATEMGSFIVRPLTGINYTVSHYGEMNAPVLHFHRWLELLTDDTLNRVWSVRKVKECWMLSVLHKTKDENTNKTNSNSTNNRGTILWY